MLDNHLPYFSPPKTNCTLWRYMDLTKLLALLENEQLFFSRADQFEDPYEGSWTKLSVESLRQSHLSWGTSQQSINGFLSIIEILRKEMFVSCWHASEHESAAMWRLFIRSSEGIAIRTDHDALASVLQASPILAHTSMINYVDYEISTFPTGNVYAPFIHKRLSFSHENELRAIIWSAANINKPQIAKDVTSITVSIVPKNLIKAVHVSPSAPQWFSQLVEQLLKRYDLQCPVERSGLYERPSY